LLATVHADPRDIFRCMAMVDDCAQLASRLFNNPVLPPQEGVRRMLDYVSGNDPFSAQIALLPQRIDQALRPLSSSQRGQITAVFLAALGSLGVSLTSAERILALTDPIQFVVTGRGHSARRVVLTGRAQLHAGPAAARLRGGDPGVTRGRARLRVGGSDDAPSRRWLSSRGGSRASGAGCKGPRGDPIDVGALGIRRIHARPEWARGRPGGARRLARRGSFASWKRAFEAREIAPRRAAWVADDRRKVPSSASCERAGLSSALLP
jgi:hypothetical protein